MLVQFWTFTCINWLRTLPYVRAWAERYREDGLVVVGAHTPEFLFEHDLDSIRRAVKEMRIDYPVAVDNDYAIWDAFANNYWPALYFIDRDGVIRDEHFGEGRYEESERSIQQLLGVEQGPHLRSSARASRRRPTGRSSIRPRPTSAASVGSAGRRATPTRSGATTGCLSGDWTIGEQGAVLNDAHGGIAFRFHARDLHLVLKPGETPVRFRVSLDGGPPGSAHGSDVDESGNGVASEPRLYQLIRQDGRIDDRTFEITFLEPGIEANVFTFG